MPTQEKQKRFFSGRWERIRKLPEEKCGFTNAGFCNVFIVLLRIEDDKNITGFIVENGPSNGISYRDREHKSGYSLFYCQVSLNETKVPVENMLAGRGERFQNSVAIGMPLNVGSH